VSDFDALLERLVADPAFQAALAANPAAVLAGYDLDPDERELLSARVVGDSGVDRTVEIRTSKSGLAGMLGPVAAAFGLSGSTHQAFGSANDAFTSAHSHEAFGKDTGHDAFGTGSGHAAFGSATGDTGEAFGAAPVEQHPEAGTFASTPEPLATDYHTHVDVDGDGKWDAYTAYQRSDGGVDIVVTDHDGRVEFVGHDYNRDGLVDDADFDTNHDGVLDTRMYDDTGDGWMDRSERIPGT
jgi:hypothetical protein